MNNSKDYYLNTILKFNKNNLLKGKFYNDINLLLSFYIEFEDKNNEKKIKEYKSSTDFIFVLDTSGSMREKYNSYLKKIEALFEAMRKVYNLLERKDTITVISFDSIAEVIVNHLNRDEVNIEDIIKKLEGKSGCNTNFKAAFEKVNQVVTNRKNEITKIIFLTDGRDTAGGDKKCLELANNIGKLGYASIDAMGIGGDFNYDYMKKFSDIANGVTENIVDITNVEKIFSNIVKSSKENIFSNFNFEIIFNKNLERLKVFQYTPEKRDLRDKLFSDYLIYNVGSLKKYETYHFFISFDLETIDNYNDKMEIFKMKYSYNDMLKGSQHSEEKEYFINLSKNKDDFIYDSSIDDVYKEFEIFLLRDDLDKLIKNNNQKEVLVKIDQIIKKCEEIDDYNMLSEYRRIKEKYMNEHKITQEDLNRISYVSSKPSVRSNVLKIKKSNVIEDNDL